MRTIQNERPARRCRPDGNARLKIKETGSGGVWPSFEELAGAASLGQTQRRSRLAEGLLSLRIAQVRQGGRGGGRGGWGRLGGGGAVGDNIKAGGRESGTRGGGIMAGLKGYKASLNWRAVLHEGKEKDI